jgi:iron complex outermembrane receptor protein
MINNESPLQPSIRKILLAVAAEAVFLMHAAVPALAYSEEDNRYIDMDLAQLMQMTITSVSKKPQALADAAAAIFVITQEDIRRSGVTTIPDALAMAPGLQVARISSSKWAISSRGFGGYTSNKLLVMIDGRSVYTPAYSGTYWDMQNVLLEDVDRIEVIRGPGGTLWGANAVNGVINIITKRSQDTLGTLVRVGVGNQEKLSTAGRYGSTIGSSAFGRLYVTTRDRGSNVLADNGQDGNDDWSNMQTGFRMDGMVGAKNEWTLQGDLYKNKGDQIVSPLWLEDFPYLVTGYNDYTDASGGNLNGSWQRRFTGGDLFTVKGYFDGVNREESFAEQTFVTVDLDLQYETLLGERNSVTMGTGYRHIDAQFDESFQIQIPDQSNVVYSAFLQDEIKLLPDRLWLTLGTKYEQNDFTDNEWQPSARLLVKPAADHTLWTAVARAVHTPSMVEDSGALLAAVIPLPAPPFGPGTQTSRLRGNADLNSEVLIAYEAGYRWQARKNLSLDVAVYYNDYDKIIITHQTLDPTSFDLVFSNAKKGDGRGVELAVNWQARSWWSLFFTYTWQEVDLEWNDPLNKVLFGDVSIYEKNYPTHQASVRSAIDFSENWQLNCWLRYVDAISGQDKLNLNELVPVSSYLVFDANVIWTPHKDLEIMFAGQNLLNSSQLEYVGEIITPSTEIERGVYGKVTWHF